MVRSLLPGMTAFLISAVAMGKEVNFEGRSYTDVSKTEMAYFEKHRLVFDGENIVSSETDYFSETGERIAELKCFYKSSRFVPDFRFIDFRSGYSERATVKGNEVTVQFKEKADEQWQEKVLTLEQGMAASQGLNELIKSHIDSIDHSNESICYDSVFWRLWCRHFLS